MGTRRLRRPRARDCHAVHEPRDNHFARTQYADTLQKHVRREQRPPPLFRADAFELGPSAFSSARQPRKLNEFLWESNPSTKFSLHRQQHQADSLAPTPASSGSASSRGKRFIKVGVLGGPENEAAKRWYTDRNSPSTGDHRFIHSTTTIRLAREMRASEKLPEESSPILTGWWKTASKSSPEKAPRGKFAPRKNNAAILVALTAVPHLRTCPFCPKNIRALLEILHFVNVLLQFFGTPALILALFAP